MYIIQFSDDINKQVKKLPKNKHQQFFNLAIDIKENPYRGKELTGELSGEYSVRLWPYRILYSIDKKNKIVKIYSVEHRKDVYN